MNIKTLILASTVAIASVFSVTANAAPPAPKKPQPTKKVMKKAPPKKVAKKAPAKQAPAKPMQKKQPPRD